jgi:hypothetical protein
MFRWLAILFFLLALITLGADIYLSFTEEGLVRLHALGEWWARIHLDSLLLLQPAIERHVSPAIWDPGIQTVLEWPAALDFAVPGAVFWLLRRGRNIPRRQVRG